MRKVALPRQGRVTLRSFSEVGYASAGFAEASEDATAVKPWSFTNEPKAVLKLDSGNFDYKIIVYD
jgi:hypothetical protein